MLHTILYIILWIIGITIAGTFLILLFEPLYRPKEPHERRWFLWLIAWSVPFFFFLSSITVGKNSIESENVFFTIPIQEWYEWIAGISVLILFSVKWLWDRE